ncbi:putative symporter YodF [Paraburkholderia nemoris]|uniref:sodium:solute symporter family protein n=1 Tax=Paraburkholderia nemoris TaxID=2793076 RepID=UPI001914B8D4|nr:sodium:solute symporter [Paraburkholderia nemoris]MBK5152870.1 sodium:solute symporter [Burkholderia sp. R-69608]CAE6970447.1 putative symporter YodF [Paraburkholderia nemoris]
MNAPLFILAFTLLVVFVLAVRARRGVKMNLEQWSVGGRGFSALLVFVLMAGEIYTTFTFLGASGFAYGFGGAAFYIIVYTTQAFVLSYWLLPAVWRFANEQKLLTQPDFFSRKYDSPVVGLLVAAVSLAALLPYLILQLKGLGILVQVSSYGSISNTWAIWIGAIVMAAYVVVSGVHGSASTAVVKDVLVLAVCVFLGLYLPYHYYGGLSEMFKAIDVAKPGFLALPEAGKNLTWYLSTIAVCGLGMFMWPHTFSSVFTAKTEDHFRRNAATMPLYALVMLFSMFVGLAAVLQIPDLKGGQIDLALLKLSLNTFDPWFVGVIGAAGLLTALVPSSIMLVSAATLFSRNIYRFARPRASESHLSHVAKLAAFALTVISVCFAIQGVQSIVALLIMGYSLVSQVLPSLLMSLTRNNPVNKLGAGSGMVIGVATVAWMVLTGSSLARMFPSQLWLRDVNPGLIALLLNVTVMFVVSAATKRQMANVPA